MQIESIDGFQGALLNVFMRAMNRVTRLKAHNVPPATFDKERAGLRRGVAIPGKALLWQAHYAYRAAEQEIPLLVEYVDAGMPLFLRAIDPAGLKLFSVRVELLNRQYGSVIAPGVNQGDLHAFFEMRGLPRLYRERDRNAPGQAVAQMHVVDNAEVVGPLEKAGQRAVRANSQHLQVRELARSKSNARQTGAFCQQFCAFGLPGLIQDKCAPVGY